MKMADVFPKPVDRLDMGDMRSFERLAAAHAINCHDDLVEVLENAVGILDAYGLGFERATEVLAKAKGGAL